MTEEGQNSVDIPVIMRSARGDMDPVRPGPVLEVENLVAGYADLAAVRDVTFSVGAGEVVALCGPNGAGKSTLLSAIAGELPTMNGSIKFNGDRMRGPTHRRVRGGVSFVPETRSVISGLSVRDNLRLGGDIESVVDLFPELKPLLGRPAGLLSGGEQQMLTVGRAIALRPRLLLVDEVSLGLAPMVADRVLSAIQGVARAHEIAVVLVEQRLNRAVAASDRWLLLQHGRLVSSGDSANPDELFQQYVA